MRCCTEQILLLLLPSSSWDHFSYTVAEMQYCSTAAAAAAAAVEFLNALMYPVQHYGPAPYVYC